MNFKTNILRNYIKEAPAALVIERSYECLLLSQQKFDRPLLDIGCGDGLFAKNLFDEKIDTGIDLNPVEIEHARALNIYNELIECSAAKVPKPDAFFKTAFSNSVLEHIPNLREVLKETHRLLCPGAFFYITVPTDQFDKYSWIYQTLQFFRLRTTAEKYRVFFNKFWAHFHYYAPEKWAQILREAGFKIIVQQDYASKKACLLNDLLVPFSLLSWLSKKFLNRWFFIPPLRQITGPVILLLLKPFMDREPRASRGGLIFFALVKE